MAITLISTQSLITRFFNKLYCLLYDDYDEEIIVLVVDGSGDTICGQIGPVSDGYYYSKLCINRDGTKAYFNTEFGFGVIDCAGDSLIKIETFEMEEFVRDIIYSSGSNRIYCVIPDEGLIAVVDGEADTLTKMIFTGGYMYRFRYNPLSDKIYCSDLDEPFVYVIDCVHDSLIAAIEFEDYITSFVFDSLANILFCIQGEYGSIPGICGAGDTILGYVPLSGWSDDEYQPACFDPIQHRIYVVCPDWSEIMVIDPVVFSVINSFLIEYLPTGVVYSSRHDKLYVYSSSSRRLGVIDCSALQLSGWLALPFSNVRGVAYNEALDKLYVAGTYAFGVFNCVNDSLIRLIQMERRPRSLLVNPVNNKVYWLERSGTPANLVVVDGVGDSIVTAIPVGQRGWSMSLNPQRNLVYCAVRGDNDSLIIIAVDGAGDSIVRWINAWDDADNASLCYIPSRDLVCSTTEDPRLIVVDGEVRQIIGPLHINREAKILFYNSLNDKLYCVEDYDLEVINCGFMEVETRIRVPAGAGALGFDSIANKIYLTHSSSNVVSITDANANQFLRLIETGGGPRALAWSPQHRWMFVANYSGQSIGVIADSAVVGVASGNRGDGWGQEMPTVCRNLLNIPTNKVTKEPVATLFDVMGGKVLDLYSGQNDMRKVVPGVYFIKGSTTYQTKKIIVVK